MPISPERHDEGEWFIVDVPNKEFKGKTEHVEFMNGRARIDDVDVARTLEQSYGYTIVFPEGYELPDWASASIEHDEPKAAPAKTEIKLVQRIKKA